MTLKKNLTALACSLVLLAFFQNCDRPAQTGFSNAASKTASQDSGQSYDGKIYVLIGELCTDGTNIRAKIILNSQSSGQLVRQDCKDIAPVTLTASDLQLNPTIPNELVYKNQTFTVSSPEAVGAGFGTLPKLATTVDPTAFGAVGDGITDNTAAFLAALNAGDILIPAGNYVVSGTIRVPAGRSIQCASLSTVKIINPLTTTTANNATFRFWSQGGSISNCHMSGAEVFNPNGSAVFNVSYQYNALVSVADYWGPNSNVKIINNIFENCHGNACVSIYGGSAVGVMGATNITVTNNTFRNCGYHSVVLDTVENGLVANNHITDCSLVIQNDRTDQLSVNNIIESNYMTVKHGNGNVGSTGTGVPYITGGTGSLAVNYSSNQIRNNTLVGNGTPGSLNVLRSAAQPAQYINNTCVNGCALQ